MTSFHRVLEDSGTGREARQRRLRANRVSETGARQRFDVRQPRAPGTTLLIIGDDDLWLVTEACVRARAENESELYVLYVSGWSRSRSSDNEQKDLDAAAGEARRFGIRLAPLTRAAEDIAEAVCAAAQEVDGESCSWRESNTAAASLILYA